MGVAEAKPCPSATAVSRPRTGWSARSRPLRHHVQGPPGPPPHPHVGRLQRPPPAEGLPGRGDRHRSRHLSRPLPRRWRPRRGRSEQEDAVVSAPLGTGDAGQTELEEDHTLLGLREMELNFGPQHPSTHGVLRIILKVDGERIVVGPPRDRLPPPRHREALRDRDVPDGHPAHGPDGLRRGRHEQPRVLPDRREAARPRDPEEGAVHPRAPRRDAAHLVAPPLARDGRRSTSAR